jgi:hypothetical protein
MGFLNYRIIEIGDQYMKCPIKLQYINNKQIFYIKKACKDMYLESRKLKQSEIQQDVYLQDLIETCFNKSIKKVIIEEHYSNKDDLDHVEEYSQGFLIEMKELMNYWKKEFEKEILTIRRKPWWKFGKY